MKFVTAKVLVTFLTTAGFRYIAAQYTEKQLQAFEQWKKDFLINYNYGAEEDRRRYAFFQNQMEIDAHNDIQNNTYYQTLNMFSDTLEVEWARMALKKPLPDDDVWGRNPQREETPHRAAYQRDYVQRFSFVDSDWTKIKPQYFKTRPGMIPSKLDWRKTLLVPNFEAVCCMVECRQATYAWAVAVTLITHYNIKRLQEFVANTHVRGEVPTMYSTQQLIDCLTTDNSDYAETNFCEYDKDGGNGEANSVIRAYKHAILNGMMSDGDYKFSRGNKTQCSYRRDKAHRVFTGYTIIPRSPDGNYDEVALMQALALYGPLTVSINADSKGWWRYKNYVLTPEKCSPGKTVSMVLVGYGVEEGKRYWNLMTPWGERFGSYGMIKLTRLSDIQSCNIATQAVFPTWDGRNEITHYDFEFWKFIENSRAKIAIKVYEFWDLVAHNPGVRDAGEYPSITG